MGINIFSKIVLKYITRTLLFLPTVECLVLHFFPKNVTLKRKLARLAYNKESKESLPENTGPWVDTGVE